MLLPLRDVKLVLLLRDVKLLLLRDAKVVVGVAVRLDAANRGRCYYSCHCRYKVCSFFPHCLEGISPVAIRRDHISKIATPNQVAIYNDDPTRSLKIACFKGSGIREVAKGRRLVRSYVLGRDFDNHAYRVLSHGGTGITSEILLANREGGLRQVRQEVCPMPAAW